MLKVFIPHHEHASLPNACLSSSWFLLLSRSLVCLNDLQWPSQGMLLKLADGHPGLACAILGSGEG